MEAKTIVRKARSIGKKRCSFETVEVPLVLKLPKAYMKFMEELARLLDTTPEAILKEETYCLLRDFCDGGYLEAYLQVLHDQYVTGDKGKELASMVEQIIDC